MLHLLSIGRNTTKQYHSNISFWQTTTIISAESGISQTGKQESQRWRQTTYYLGNVCRKLHESENWADRGRVSSAPPPNPPMTMYTYRWSCRGWGSTVFSRSTCRCEFHHRCTCTSVLHSARPLNTPTPRNTGYSSTATQAHSSFLKIHTLSRRDSFTLDELERNKFWT